MIERTSTMARRYAESLSNQAGVEVLNEVELNQVLVRFRDRNGDASQHTPAVLARVQQRGIAYPTGTAWRGEPAIRISVSNWMIEEEDVDATVRALLEAHATV
jgi:glutamate/tyrosine decarboxylase-like PLP-dependent enzyme